MYIKRIYCIKYVVNVEVKVKFVEKNCNFIEDTNNPNV